jgi:hypothetical protein
MALFGIHPAGRNRRWARGSKTEDAGLGGKHTIASGIRWGLKPDVWDDLGVGSTL